MSILEIYLLGVVAAAVHIIWFEYQFDHNKQLSNVTSWPSLLPFGDLMVASRRIVRKERPEYIVFFCHF